MLGVALWARATGSQQGPECGAQNVPPAPMLRTTDPLVCLWASQSQLLAVDTVMGVHMRGSQLHTPAGGWGSELAGLWVLAFAVEVGAFSKLWHQVDTGTDQISPEVLGDRDFGTWGALEGFKCLTLSVRDRDLQLHQSQPGLTSGLGQVWGWHLSPSVICMGENRRRGAVAVTGAGVDTAASQDPLCFGDPPWAVPWGGGGSDPLTPVPSRGGWPSSMLQ